MDDSSTVIPDPQRAEESAFPGSQFRQNTARVGCLDESGTTNTADFVDAAT